MATHPKWLPDYGLIADSPEIEAAVRNGTAILKEIKSAQGNTIVASLPPLVQPAAKKKGK